MEQPLKRKRRPPGSKSANSETNYKMKKSPPPYQVKAEFGAAAFSLASEIGMLDRLRITLKILEPNNPNGRTSVMDRTESGTWVLLILSRDFGLVAFTSSSWGALNSIQQAAFPSKPGAQLIEIEYEGGPGW